MKIDKRSESSFSLTPENLKKAEEQIKKYPKGYQASAVKAILDLAQRQNKGYLTKESMDWVAHFLQIPPIQVYEVATFYNLFNLSPVGQYHVQFCRTISCWLQGGEEVRKACEIKLGIRVGETTSDGLFTLSEVECLGACVNAPVAQVNDDYVEDLTPQGAVALLEKLATEGDKALIVSSSDKKALQRKSKGKETPLKGSEVRKDLQPTKKASRQRSRKE